MTPEKLFNWILKAGYTSSGLGVEWTLKNKEGEVYLLFQGSTTKEDWWHNFQFLPTAIKPYNDMKRPWYAHEGFVRMYKSARDTILAAVAVSGSQFIHVAGHSQGGGLAQLCAEDLAWRGYKVECVTFGSPNVFYGSQARKHLNDMKIIAENYENGSDIVPMVPPFGFKLNPVHVGEPFKIRNILHAADYHMGYGDPGLYK